MASADAVTRVWEEKYRELEKLFEQLRLELEGIKRKKEKLEEKIVDMKNKARFEVAKTADQAKMEEVNKKIKAIK